MVLHPACHDDPVSFYGQYVITPEMGLHRGGAGREVSWRRTRDGLEDGALGIKSGAELRAKPLSFLQQHFGKSAAWYLGITNGEDDRPAVVDRPRKSSGSETTFKRDLTGAYKPVDITFWSGPIQWSQR
jgi:hypothetical protein